MISISKVSPANTGDAGSLATSPAFVRTDAMFPHQLGCACSATLLRFAVKETEGLLYDTVSSA